MRLEGSLGPVNLNPPTAMEDLQSPGVGVGGRLIGTKPVGYCQSCLPALRYRMERPDQCGHGEAYNRPSQRP
jgi:hypothetical protein